MPLGWNVLQIISKISPATTTQVARTLYTNVDDQHESNLPGQEYSQVDPQWHEIVIASYNIYAVAKFRAYRPASCSTCRELDVSKKCHSV
jgi:hypothetical protein